MFFNSVNSKFFLQAESASKADPVSVWFHIKEHGLAFKIHSLGKKSQCGIISTISLLITSFLFLQLSVSTYCP